MRIALKLLDGQLPTFQTPAEGCFILNEEGSVILRVGEALPGPQLGKLRTVFAPLFEVSGTQEEIIKALLIRCEQLEELQGPDSDSHLYIVIRTDPADIREGIEPRWCTLALMCRRGPIVETHYTEAPNTPLVEALLKRGA